MSVDRFGRSDDVDGPTRRTSSEGCISVDTSRSPFGSLCMGCSVHDLFPLLAQCRHGAAELKRRVATQSGAFRPTDPYEVVDTVDAELIFPGERPRANQAVLGAIDDCVLTRRLCDAI